MNLLSDENLDKARNLPRPVALEPTGLELPDTQLLEDARWQQAHAGEKVAQHVAYLRQALQATPSDTPAARAKYERSAAFLRSLEQFFAANAALLELLDQREETMMESMAEAQFTYHQMSLDRNFYLHEARTANARYYAENDLAKLIAARLDSPSHAA